jgi:ATP-dependent phosphofructokinase / diphosphate-dependent phosphofructokinase
VTSKRKKMGILTGGGDCAGLNSAIKRLVLGAYQEYDVEGLVKGWEGPIRMALASNSTRSKTIETYTMPLGPEQVRRLDRAGGTVLMSSRANPFKYKDNDVSEQVIKFLNSRYHTLIAIGGNDTLGAAGKMAQKGLRVVGVPKTIDKDLCGTEYSLGFDSAVNVMQMLVVNLKSTAGSHGMTYFIEVMGRNAGHLAYWGGRAAHVHFMTIPEIVTDSHKLFTLIENRKKKMPLKRGFNLDGLRYTIVLVSEGTRLKGVGEIHKGGVDPHGNVYLGGVADFMCNEYIKQTGDKSARSLTLGHIQRSGPPSNRDGLVAEAFSQRALELVQTGGFGRMSSIMGNSVDDTPLDVVIGRIRILDAQECFDSKNYQPRISPERIFNEIEVANK